MVTTVHRRGAHRRLAPRIAAQFRIMMMAVNLLGDKAAHNAADKDVRRKVLLGADARVGH